MRPSGSLYDPACSVKRNRLKTVVPFHNTPSATIECQRFYAYTPALTTLYYLLANVVVTFNSSESPAFVHSGARNAF